MRWLKVPTPRLPRRLASSPSRFVIYSTLGHVAVFTVVGANFATCTRTPEAPSFDGPVIEATAVDSAAVEAEMERRQEPEPEPEPEP
ncbi:TonB C-terminal domain-containing protein, partial [Halorhodospira sp. 9622]|nr:TonB C-terminal domain-containing protein [Halorhodospira sp. 9622]